MKSRAVFLDRDGVINQNRDDYVKSWEEFVFIPGALDALENLARTAFQVVVVTNQAAIGRGYVTQSLVWDIHCRMIATVNANGGRIDAVYHCPHTPEQGCCCRKPAPGLYLRAAKELDLDLTRSYSIGDKQSDLDAGARVGCEGILVLTGKGKEEMKTLRQRYRLVRDLRGAVELIRLMEDNGQ